MFEITGEDNMGSSPQIGTEILDPTMPSDLNFDGGNQEYEGQQISRNANYVKDSQAWGDQEIKSFTVKGKCSMEMEPKYRQASIVMENLKTFQVKAYDE